MLLRNAVRVGCMFMLCIPVCESFGWIKAAVSVCHRFYTIYQNYNSIFFLDHACTGVFIYNLLKKS